MLNPSRMILARKRRRLSGRELASRCGLSQEHLSRIEHGKALNVETETIASLAEALQFPLAFFFGGEDAEMPPQDSVSFRSLSSMSAKERDTALAAGAIAFLISDWVTERFNLPEDDLLDLRFENPESAAKALRSYWGVGQRPIANAIKLLESRGVRVFSLSEETRNLDAFSCWHKNVPYVFLNTNKTSERSRFDAFHELGHLVLHRHGKPQGRAAEQEADLFASSFLMPKLDVLGNVPRRIVSLEQLVKLKKRWGVSVAALNYRLHKMGVVSDWQYRNFCIQINKKFGTGEPDGMARERSVVWDKVFRELWKERSTKDHVAEELSIPTRELDELMFNLVRDSESSRELTPTGGPSLRLA